MKAISIDDPGGPESLQLTEVAEPQPEAGEVTIDVAFAGVGFVDVLLRRGAFSLPMPLTPGIEVSGRVREIGLGVEHLSPGEPVAALLNDFVNLRGAGGYAEVAKARAALTVRLDAHADLATAASVLVNGATAWMAISTLARVQKDECVLVLGATGGLGALLGQLARKAGAARIIGVVGSAAKREVAARLGYSDVLAADDLATSLKRVMADRGVDVVFDPVGGSARRIAFEHLAPLGRLVILGNASGVDESFSGDAFWHGSKAVMGLSLGAMAHLFPDRVAAAARQVLGWAARNDLATEPPLVLPLAEAADAHRMLEARKVSGKIVLRVAA